MNNTALLLMDLQPGIIDRASDKEAFLDRVQKTASWAREQEIPVIWVVVGFSKGFPEAPHEAGNKVFDAIGKQKPEKMIDPKPVIEMKDLDIFVTKRRVSAFTGSNLEVVLRARRIRNLVISGIMTSGVVLSTVREAADKDYQITVLSDLCADPNHNVHTMLMENIFPWQAHVTTSDEWMKG